MDGYKTNHNNTTFESHEDGPLKYVEIGRKREVKQRIGEKTLRSKDPQTEPTQSEYSINSEKNHKLWNKAKKALASIASSAIDFVVEKTRKLRNKAKIPLAIIALSAIAITLNPKENPKGNNIPRNQTEWEKEAADKTFGMGGHSVMKYNKNGSKIELTADNTYYTLEDPDNDTFIEKATAVNKDGVANFESSIGEKPSAVKKNLDRTIPEKHD